MAYVDLELLTEKLHKKLVDCSLNKKIKKTLAFFEMCDAIKECPKIDIVRCKDCEYWQDKNSKGTQGVCLCGEKDMNYGGEFYPLANDFCSYGKLKTTKQTTCKDCKYLMFSDCYGECSKQLRIVNPKDTCQHAEPRTPKERGGEK